MKKTLTFVAVIICFYLYHCLSSPVQASDQFLTTFLATYNVDDNGNTTVSQNVILENRFANIFATEYALEVGSTRIFDIVVIDSLSQPIPFTKTQTDNTTIIRLNFDEQVVGKGQKHQFKITYQNPDISSKNGQVLEVNIPRISNLSDIENYSVQLSLPKDTKQPDLISPTNYQTVTIDDKNYIKFDRKDLLDKGITALFGNQQLYDLTLNYHLENPTSGNGITQIALPPDTAYQKVYYHHFEPKPKEVKQDTDGNWLATYLLKPKERIDVIIKAQAQVYLNPTVPVSTNTLQLDEYLKEQTYWPVSDPKIQKLSQELNTPEKIYNYLVQNFTYNYSRLDSTKAQRLGALQALETPDDVICQEFTDTFIALARAAGIPAREINGYAFTENEKLRPLSLIQDVLHAWPEYYDQSKDLWVPVDPTWGNTTGGIDYFHSFDLNHIAFAIHAQSSTTPYPAGYYKFENTISKDILVEFAQEFVSIQPSFEYQLSIFPTNILGLSTQAKLSILNNSPQAYYDLPLNLSTNNYQLISPAVETIDTILPFTQKTVKLQLKPLRPFQTAPGELTITTLDQTSTHEITNYKNYNQNLIIFITIFLATTFFIFTFFAGRLLVHRFKKASALRRKSQEPSKQN